MLLGDQRLASSEVLWGVGIISSQSLSSSFRIAGICAETSRTRAPGKQCVCTLPSANVARTCRTMESPTITASRSISQRGAKRLRVEISKIGGGGGGDVVARGLARVFRCCCTQGLWCPSAGVKDIWEDRVLGARGLCRETHGVVVGVLAACCILTRTCERQPGMFPAQFAAPSAGPAFPAARWSASPRPPAPDAPNAARTHPHLHSNVDTNPPLK